MPRTDSLLDIDIRALGDLVERLFQCYTKTESIDEFPAVLERLRGNIDDARWQRKIIYFHAICALWPNWNKAAGKGELKKLGSIEDGDDEETVQVYLDLFGDDLGFSQKHDLIDRILKLTKKLSDRLHYKGSKAVLYLGIGDVQKAEAELDEAVSEVRSRDMKHDLTEYERLRLHLPSNCLAPFGAIRLSWMRLWNVTSLC
jgi:hypothetical protein